MAADHTHTRHCVKLLARLSEWIDNELDPPTRQRIERHIAACPACQVCLQTLTRTASLCRELDHSALPEAVVERIMGRVKKTVSGTAPGR